MRRKLAAGNWKMNGLSENMAEVQSLIAAFPAPAASRYFDLSARDLARGAWRTVPRQRHRAWGAILPYRNGRGAYGRYFRAHAQGCRGRLCDCGPFRAAC